MDNMQSPTRQDLIIPTDIALNVSPNGTVVVWESFGADIRVTILAVGA